MPAPGPSSTTRSLIIHDHDHRSVQLVIAAHRIPNVTGLEILARMRRVDRCTPFILLATSGDRTTHEEAMRLGASCVLASLPLLQPTRKMIPNSATHLGGCGHRHRE